MNIRSSWSAYRGASFAPTLPALVLPLGLLLSHAAWATANPSSATVNEDGSANIQVTASGSGNTFAIRTQPRSGTLTSVNSSTWRYTPTADYNGLDGFTFTATDRSGTVTTAKVSITVIAVNDRPVADAVTLSTNEDVPVSTSLPAEDPDGDVLTYAVATQPAAGSVSISTGGVATYTPPGDWAGITSFRYALNDGTVSSNSALVSVTVIGTDDPPVATNQSLALDEDSTLTITLSATDVDTNSNQLTYAVTTTPAHGTVTAVGGAQYRYTPAADYTGADSFRFTVSDAKNTTGGRITLTISPQDDFERVVIRAPASTTYFKPLNGGVTGKLVTGLPDLDAAVLSMLSESFTGFRNQDVSTGALDMTLMFNASESISGTCVGDRDNGLEYPCWAAKAPTSPDDPTLFFDSSDSFVSSIADAGFDLIYRVGDSTTVNNLELDRAGGAPNDLCGATVNPRTGAVTGGESDGSSFKGVQGANELANYTDAAVYSVEHFDDTFPGLFDWIDIHSEAQNPHFFDVTDDPDESGCGEVGEDGVDDGFSWYIATLFDALKSAFPDKTIGGVGFHGGMNRMALGETDTPAYQFFSDIWNWKDTLNVQLDFLDIHIFDHEDPASFYYGPLALRDLMRGEQGDIGYEHDYTAAPWAGSGLFDDTQIIVGEYNVDPGSASADMVEELREGALGMAIQAAQWIGMQNSGVVEHAFWYNAFELNGAGGADSSLGTIAYPEPCRSPEHECYDGYEIIRRPIAYGLRLEKEFVEEFPARLENPTPLGGDYAGTLWWVGGEDTPRRRAILLSNTSETETQSFRLSYVRANGEEVDQTSFVITVYQVDDVETGDTVVWTAPLGYDELLTIAPSTVQLIVLTR